MNSFCAIAGFWCALIASASAANWPGLRGPGGSGVAKEKNLPLRWSTNENVAWRVALPDRGNSTPIVWGERIFITQATEGGNRRSVMCFDRRDGKVLWQSGVTRTEKEPSHDENPPCTPSPVTDGQRVIAWFGSAGVHCYDFNGREVWRTDLGPQAHQWGYASSPVLYRDLCFLNFGPGDRSFVIALDKKTGRTVWKFDIPILGTNLNEQELRGPDQKVPAGAEPTKLSEIAGSWATPLVVVEEWHAGTARPTSPGHNGDEVVVALPLRLVAFALRTGKQLWSSEGPSIGAYGAAPFYGEGFVAYAGCGFRNNLMLVRPGGRGDVTKTHRVWTQTFPGNSSVHLGAGVIFQGHIYLVNIAGMAECFELTSGRNVWTERLPSTGAVGASWSSPVLVGDLIYVSNRNADVFVFKAAPKFELLAINSVGGERMSASLAVSDGEIFIRTDKHLWCIGSRRR